MSTPLAAFIKTQLMYVMSEENANAIVSNDRYMRSFQRALKHSSVTTDETQNYEVEEHTGDAYLKLITNKYIDARVPGMPLASRTRLSGNLVAKQTLARMSKSLGFGDFIVSDAPLDNSMFEDIFEAFVGVLARVCISIWGEPFDYIYVREYVYKAFDRLNLNYEKLAERDPKTSLKEDVFDALGWKVATLRNRGLYEFQWNKITLCDSASSAGPALITVSQARSKAGLECQAYFIDVIMDPFGRVITWAFGKDSKTVTNHASASALQYFESLKLTKEQINEYFGPAHSRSETNYVITPKMLREKGIDYPDPSSKTPAATKITQITQYVQEAWSRGRARNLFSTVVPNARMVKYFGL